VVLCGTPLRGLSCNYFEVGSAMNFKMMKKLQVALRGLSCNYFVVGSAITGLNI
jgi:hypothetical protein